MGLGVAGDGEIGCWRNRPNDGGEEGTHRKMVDGLYSKAAFLETVAFRVSSRFFFSSSQTDNRWLVVSRVI